MHIPDLRLWDEANAQQTTLRDLLTHRTEFSGHEKHLRLGIYRRRRVSRRKNASFFASIFVVLFFPLSYHCVSVWTSDKSSGMEFFGD